MLQAQTSWPVRGALLATLLLLLVPGQAPAQDGTRKNGAPTTDATKKTKKRTWEKIPKPPLRAFRAPTPERVVLENGAVLFLLPDHELPLIDVIASFRGGRVAAERRERAGLAAITADVMRTGGTKAHPGDALDEQLESIAASIEVSAGLTQAGVSLSCLKESFAELLPVLVDVIAHPAFPEDKLELSRKQILTGISRRNDDPSGIAERELDRAIYGDALPYGWSEERDTVRAITREDLLACHKALFQAKGAVIAVVGDFDPATLKPALVKAFSALPPGEAGAPMGIKMDGGPPKVYVIDRPELNQSTIRMGHLGVQRRPDDEDYFAVVVANSILGGGAFTSRLFQKVRTDLGLAYSVGSGYYAPYTHPGTFLAVCQTKCETTFQAIQAIRAEIERIRTEPVKAEELSIAKDAILQQLIFASASRLDVAKRAQRYELYGFPLDYLERFQKGIAKVTVADVQRVAKAYLHPDAMTTVIVGKVSAFDGDPATLGEVVTLDVDQPAFRIETDQAAKPAIGPEALAAGRKLIAAVAEAMGGAEALSKVRSLRVKATGQAVTPQGPIPIQIQSVTVYPDRVRSELVLPFGTMVQCFDGTSGWMSTPAGVTDLPPSEAKKLKQQVQTDTVQTVLALLKLAEGPPLVKRTTAYGHEVGVLETKAHGRLFVDLGTHLIVRKENEGPRGTVATSYAEFRKVGQVMLAHRIETTMDGQPVMSVSIEKMEVNPELGADAFARPAK